MVLHTHLQRNPVKISYSTRGPKARRREANLKTIEFPSFTSLQRWLRKESGTASRKEGPYIIAGPTIKGTSHSKNNIGNLGCIIIEFDGKADGPTVSLTDAVALFEAADIAVFGYETWSHEPDADRWRIIIATSRQINVNGSMELLKVFDYLKTQFSEEFGVIIGHETKNHNRIWYTPRWPKGQTRTIKSVRGRNCLDIDAIIEWHKDNEHYFELPKRRSNEKTNVDTNSTIGAYNAEHDPRDLLLAAGYQHKGSSHSSDIGLGVERYSCPFDPDTQPGVMAFEQPDGWWRIYSHHVEMDPLWNKDGYSHDAFSVYVELEHDGDRDAALRTLQIDSFDIEEDVDIDTSEPPITEPKTTNTVDSLIERLPPVHQILASQLLTCPVYPLRNIALFGSIAIAQMLANRMPYLESGDDDKIYGNCYYLFLAKTGAGKNTVLRLSRLYCETMGIKTIRKIGSTAGLETQIMKDENHGLLVALQDEYNPMNPQQIDISLALNEMFDAVDGVYDLRALKEDSDKTCANPFAMHVACTTPTTHFHIDPKAGWIQATGGKLRRTLIVQCEEKRVRNVNHKRPVVHNEINQWYENLRERYGAKLPDEIDNDDKSALRQSTIRVRLSKEAHDFVEEKVAQVDNILNQTEDEIQHAILTGMEYLAKKIALSLRLGRSVKIDRRLTVSFQEMELAWDIMEYYAETMGAALRENMTLSPLDADIRTIKKKVMELLANPKQTVKKYIDFKRGVYKERLLHEGLVPCRVVHRLAARQLNNPLDAIIRQLNHTNELKIKTIETGKTKQKVHFYKL